MEIDYIDPHAMFLSATYSTFFSSFPIVEVQHIIISSIWPTIIYKYIPHIVLLT